VRSLLAPVRRVLEATPAQVAAAGAWGGTYGRDPIDGDTGYRAAGRQNRDVPYWTRERAVAYSITAYRMNPMARAIIDTYTSFCVGDSGVTWQCTNPDVAKVVDEWWTDPRNCTSEQDLQLRSMLVSGERLMQMLVGERSGVVRWGPLDPSSIKDVKLDRGNPLWPAAVVLGNTVYGSVDPVEDTEYTIVQVDEASGLRTGEAMFWRPFRTLETDVRSTPFLMPVLDWLDNYDSILSNLMDRTALGRYLVWDVTVQGGQAELDAFIASKGGQLQVPPSGSVEVHTDSVTWDAKTVTTGADEDSATSKLALTSVAAGTGLARTWLADPEDSNRATSLTMAEPVRRRVGGIQKLWLAYQTEVLRFVVDRAVAAGRLPVSVESIDPKTGQSKAVKPSETVTVTGPEIAAADAQITAGVLLNLSTALTGMVDTNILSREAASIAAQKGWESFVGIPYRKELDDPAADTGDVATYVDANQAAESALLALVR
jgi:hypothetical protein